MQGVYSAPPKVLNDSHDGLGIYRIGPLTIQTIPVVCETTEPVTLNFPEPFTNSVIACFAINAQVGYGAPQAVSCGAISLSQCIVAQYNTVGANCAINVVAIGY